MGVHVERQRLGAHSMVTSDSDNLTCEAVNLAVRTTSPYEPSSPLAVHVVAVVEALSMIGRRVMIEGLVIVWRVSETHATQDSRSS